MEAEDKRRARLNMIAHLLSSVPWEPVETPDAGAARPAGSATGYERPPRERFRKVPDHAALWRDPARELAC